MLTSLREKRPGSPTMIDVTVMATAAATICSAEKTSGAAERVRPRVMMLPSAQPNDPRNNASAPTGLT